LGVLAKGLRSIPHLGGVSLGEGVEVGEYATICRGVLGDTRIGHHSMIGHHVNIGHECKLMDNVRLAPHCTIGGGVQIQDGAVLWQNVCVADKVKIGADAVIGMGSVVLKDVPSGEVWAGNPARFIRKRTTDDPRGLGRGRL